MAETRSKRRVGVVRRGRSAWRHTRVAQCTLTPGGEIRLFSRDRDVAKSNRPIGRLRALDGHCYAEPFGKKKIFKNNPVYSYDTFGISSCCGHIKKKNTFCIFEKFYIELINLWTLSMFSHTSSLIFILAEPIYKKVRKTNSHFKRSHYFSKSSENFQKYYVNKTCSYNTMSNKNGIFRC